MNPVRLCHCLLSHRYRRSGARVVGLLVWLLALTGPIVSQAADIDVAAGEVVISANSVCSLREAIVNANDGAATHSDCAAGTSGADTVILATASTYSITDIDNHQFGPNGLPPIASEIVIEGRGATIQRSSASAIRLFRIRPEGSLTVVDTTLGNGRAEGGSGGGPYHTGGDGAGGGGAGLGGAIFNEGTLDLRRVTIVGSVAAGGHGGDIIDWETSHGGGTGGTRGYDPNGVACGIGTPEGHPGCGGDVGDDGGFGGGAGGAMGGVGPPCIPIDPSCIGDSMGVGGFGGGGAGSASPGVGGLGGFGGGRGAGCAEPDCSDPVENFGGGGLGAGGAIFNRGGTVMLTNSTLSGNSAVAGTATAPAEGGHGYGGAIFNLNGTLAVVGSTFKGNVAEEGGGLYNLGLVGTAILELNNTILADSVASTDCVSAGATTPSGGDNLVESNNGCPGAVVTGDPLLGSLASNGGTTQTHALAAGSPAVDQIADSSCGAASATLGIDQRGGGRSFDGDGSPSASECDIGSYELRQMIQLCAPFSGAQNFVFASGTTLSITIDIQGTIGCIEVEEMGTSHAVATLQTLTDNWFRVAALTGGGAAASGFSLSLTLPHPGYGEPEVCRWPDAAGWDCDVSFFDASTVTRSGVTVLGDLAVGSFSRPTFAKAFAADTIFSGLPSTLTFTIGHSGGAAAANDLAFTDPLPAGVVIAPPANAVDGCGGSLTAGPGSTTITYSGGSVAGDATCTVSVDVTSAILGAHLNTSGDLTTNHGNSGPASATLTVLPRPGFAKSFSPSIIASGGTSTLTFTVDNSESTLPVSSLAFADPLPAGVIVATPSGPVDGCGGTLTASDGSATITYSGGSVAAGTTCAVSVDVTSSVIGEHLNNSSSLTSSAGNSGPASATLTVPGPPAFSKDFAPDAIFSGDTSTLSFTIDSSSNTVALGNLAFVDNLPAGVTIAAAPAAGTTCTGGMVTAPAGGTTVSYSNGTVAAGGVCTVFVDVTAAGSGEYLNTSGSLISDVGDSGQATDTLTVVVPPTLAMSFNPAAIVDGSTGRLVFTIDSSTNPLEVQGLAFSNTLPIEVEVAATPNASSSCSGGSLGYAVNAGTGETTISYSGGSIGAAATCTVEIDVTGDIVGAHVNTSSQLTSDPGTSPEASATLTVLVNDADLAIDKNVDNATPLVGSQVLFTVTLANNGPRDATGVLVEDQLPAGLAFVSANPSQGSYDEPSGAWDVGAVANGGNATLEISCAVQPPPMPPETTTTNVAAILAVDQNDPNASNDTASAQIDRQPLDFGDAPDPLDATAGRYPTLLASLGARHGGDGSLRLGALWDSEYDGQSDPAADGDDSLDASDDEDGVNWTSAVVQGETATVVVEVVGTGKLNAWVDWNSNGTWLDPGEQVIVDAIVDTNNHSYAVAVPADAAQGPTFARFRLDSAGGLGPTGPAPDGEVEDHRVVVETPSFEVAVTPAPSSLPEPGGAVTFSLVVDNSGTLEAQLVALSDDHYGELADPGNPNLVSTSCSVPQTISTGGSYHCSFTATATGNAGEARVNTVTATGTGGGFPISASGQSIVTLTRVAPSLRVYKTASPTSIAETGAAVTMSLSIENTSVDSDPVSLSSLVDVPFGDVSQVQGDIQSTTCVLPQLINPGATYTCQFIVWIDGNAGELVADLVTAAGTDDDGDPVSGSASVAVLLTDAWPEITVTKTADPTSLLEPGGDATFTVVVDNGTVEQITLTALVDDVHGDLDGQGSCVTPQIIAGNGAYTCAFTKALTGQGGTSETNTVTATVEDDEGNQVQAQDSATISFTEARAPVVSAVTSGGVSMSDCETLTAPVLGLGVALSAEALPLSHADELTSYLLVQSGPDGEFATASCGSGAAGDDSHIVPVGLSYVSAPGGGQVSLELADALAPGLYRFLVCDAITDAAANPLDGDNDGNAGGDFMVYRFRIDPGNLLVNGDFDDCPVSLWPWMPDVEPGSGNTIQIAFGQDRDLSPLSGSANISIVGEAASSLSQCVDGLNGGQSYLLRGHLLLEPTGGVHATALVSIDSGCRFFDLPDCAGAELGNSSTSTLVMGTEEPWLELETTLTATAGTMSALCRYTLQPESTVALGFEAYLDGLFLGETSLIFKDGFESGGMSRWWRPGP